MALSAFSLVLSILAVNLSAEPAEPKPLHSFCSATGGTFVTNTTYESNLNSAFSTLLSSAPAFGYNASTAGSGANRVFSIALCRGDVEPSDCRDCVREATSNAEQNCPYRRAANIYYDFCHLRYSNRQFISTLDTSDRFYLWNPNSTGQEDASRFNASVWAMLSVLRTYAVRNATSPPLFAAGEIAFGGPNYARIIGLVQCSRDLSAGDCDVCLGEIFKDLPRCCEGHIGGRVVAASCNFRFETYDFITWSDRLSLPAITVDSRPGNWTSTKPLSPPPARPPATTDDNTGRSGYTDQKESRKWTTIALGISIAIGAIALILLICTCFYFNLGKKAESSTTNNGEPLEISTVESLLFDLASIKNATNNFSPSNKLGEGGFGPVFQGRLSDGREVAVKRLSANSNQGIEELKNEVLLLAKLQHRNLVKLLGVCIEGGERSLIYELVTNKSLDLYLSHPVKKLLLCWRMRYNIIKGIARGLLYLHEESQLRIVHRDLKSSNILLDSDMNPKISDFGLARLFHGDLTKALTNRVMGTLGYMAPEYVMRGHYSIKSDVYSFGILVLEVLTGRKNTDLVSDSSQRETNLLNHVWYHWSQGSAVSAIDPSMEEDFQDSEAVRCLQIGLLCVQKNPADRPSMSSIALMLGSESISIASPSKPAFLAEYVKDDGSTMEVSESKDNAMIALAMPDEVSVTELSAR